MNAWILRADQENAAWKAAYQIAWIGASNPKGVRHAIEEHAATVGNDHTAVRAMQGHLDYLEKKSLGPAQDVLQEVASNAKRLGYL